MILHTHACTLLLEGDFKKPGARWPAANMHLVYTINTNFYNIHTHLDVPLHNQIYFILRSVIRVNLNYCKLFD